MKARRTYATLIATLLAVGSVGSTPSLARDSRYLKVAYSAVLNGKEIPAGEYRVSWKTHSPEATIAFARGGEVMLTVEGRWTDRQVRYERNTVVYNLNPDGSRTILEIRFAGLRSVLVFGGTRAAGAGPRAASFSCRSGRHSVFRSRSNCETQNLT